MHRADEIITSVESLEAQLDRAKECLQDGDWERLEQLAQGLARTAAYLASAISHARIEDLASLASHRLPQQPRAANASSAHH
ncbi:MAG TPA: hypothetical protein VGZ29_10415 [Terriglobia bacterium]|nr:hypothetical protein [Terriglobia bacterium]